MNTFGSIYSYECKKIWDKKLVKISFVFCLIWIILSCTSTLFGRYYIDGEFIGSAYNEIRKDQAYARKLNGREIDQQLLTEMAAAYRKISYTQNKHYASSTEYQKYARSYSAICNFVVNNTDLQTTDIFKSWEPSEQDLYSQRLTELEKNWENIGLSENEMNFWKERESQIDKPITFQEHEAYGQMFSYFQTMGFLVIMFISISLSGVFPNEHRQRTDQLVLSSPMGKKKLYWAKIFAGVSYAAGITLVFFVLGAVLIFALYGSQGFNAALQLHYASNSDPITIGQAILIAYGNMLVMAVLISIAVMILSELLHSSIAALAISAGLLIAAIIAGVPQYYRSAAQIWDWLPWCFLTQWHVFEEYTLPLFGIHLTPWQAVPIIYALLSAAVAWGGKSIYDRYQVSGR